MYKNEKYNTKINIALDNGIYVFDETSATGKTRLCNELKELRKLGEPVIGYTYNDDKLGIDLCDLVNRVHPKVILLDRYDMYNGMFDEQIIKWSSNATVLIACKGYLSISSYTEWCCIDMQSARIEVTA